MKPTDENAAIRLITFDLDGTLWDVEPVLVRAEQELERWLHRRCPDHAPRLGRQRLLELRMQLCRRQPQLLSHLSQLRHTALEQALRESGMAPAQAAKLAAEGLEVFLEFRHQVQYFDQVLQTLEQLSRHYLLGALTNGNADIRRLGLDCYFSFAFSAEALGSRKPEPGHFQAALKQAETPPGQAIHIGDHPRDDIWGAQRQGMHTIWVNIEEQPWQSERPAPTHQVSRWGEPLLQAVAEISRGFSASDST